ncbi:MAG: quinolinate synthase NadA [Candidatus Omnitrophica bacterium]|nr:quinolinate synthase NadA [Candidatus Omnitrophota bacterium]MCM8794034.1 quinolinate synthase NadA [Candidatus Omnitrophota bacterium]
MVYTIDDERRYIENLKQKIAELKKERRAVIIVHNYQREEVQDIADYTGDSLELSRAVINIAAEVIVFCGVHFMAESAAILNPDKKVLLPVKEAGCPMADMVTAEKLRAMRQNFPDAAVVCYVNSSARVKAESDICCTSSNAIEVVRSLPHKRIIFVPDKNLGAYIQNNVPEKEIILWNGFCPTHIRLTEEEVMEMKKIYPQAEFIAHPECRPEVVALADKVLSTGGMFKYVKNSPAKEFIIGTERGLVYRLKKENPEKKFYLPSEHLVCANMKLITLGWIAHSLEFMVHEVKVPEEIRVKAKLALERMLEVSQGAKWQAIAGY